MIFHPSCMPHLCFTHNMWVQVPPPVPFFCPFTLKTQNFSVIFSRRMYTLLYAPKRNRTAKYFLEVGYKNPRSALSQPGNVRTCFYFFASLCISASSRFTFSTTNSGGSVLQQYCRIVFSCLPQSSPIFVYFNPVCLQSAANSLLVIQSPRKHQKNNVFRHHHQILFL